MFVLLEALVALPLSDGPAVGDLDAAEGGIDLVAEVEVVVLRHVSHLAAGQLQQGIDQGVVSRVSVVFAAFVLQVAVFDEGDESCLEGLYASELLADRSVCVLSLLRIFELGGEAYPHLLLDCVILDVVAIYKVGVVPAVEGIDELEHMRSQELIVSVHQRGYLLLHAEGANGSDRARQEVLLLVVPDQLHPSLAVLFLEELLDGLDLVRVVAIRDVDHGVIRVILVEDGVEGIFMCVPLFVAAGVDDHADGKLLREFVDFVLGLESAVLLLVGLCALVFGDLGIVEVVLGQSQQLEVLIPLFQLELFAPPSVRHVLGRFGLLALLILCLTLLLVCCLTTIFDRFYLFALTVAFALQLLQNILKRRSHFRLPNVAIFHFARCLLLFVFVFIFGLEVELQVALHEVALFGLAVRWLEKEHDEKQDEQDDDNLIKFLHQLLGRCLIPCSRVAHGC